SVVYLWHGPNRESVEVVQYWSSNKKGGYGRAEVPRSKIKQMLFSRLDHPERINQIGDGLKPDEYLASMLIRGSTPEEMKKMVGIPASALADPIPAARVGKETKRNGTDLPHESLNSIGRFKALKRRIVPAIAGLINSSRLVDARLFFRLQFERGMIRN